jgi:membrane fusion protein, multidrug efflux system
MRWLTGQTVNLMTLGGLALAIGILVDESTVAVENIHRRLARGEPAGVAPGTMAPFTVPALPGERFTGVVRRISRSLDAKTRTMPVELDVDNASGKLAPGMFPEVNWPSRRPRPSLFVPPTAVATTTERTFVIRVREGQVEWVDVKRGVAINQPGGDLLEVFGDLVAGDQIASRGTDELRPGLRVAVKKTAASR